MTTTLAFLERTLFRNLERCTSFSKQRIDTRRLATRRDESIEAVFVFHRHGDRTPGKPLVSKDCAEEDAAFWRTKIPSSDGSSYFEALSEGFPVVRSPSGGSDRSLFRETYGGNESYGYLTWKGMHQMYHNGVAFSNRYKRNNGLPFDEFWDVKAVSTNYLRTAKSCQSFLDGLMSQKTLPSKPLNYKHPTHYEAVNLEEYRSMRSTAIKIPIQILDGGDNYLNAFESSPEIMKKLVGDVFASEDFITKDLQARPLAEELSDYIPGLSKYSSYGGKSSPSGIHWIHAADHFVCRSSHSVPATKFAPHLLERHNGNSARIHDEFEALGRATANHLMSRFRSYYTNPSLLAQMAGPALNEVRAEMHAHISKEWDSEGTQRRPFRIYSCHDVTLLALLYALKDRFLQENDPLLSKWPSYASCLTFELVRRNDEQYAVRVWLNEAPIPNFCITRVPLMTTPNLPLRDEIKMSTFHKLIDDLNLQKKTN